MLGSLLNFVTTRVFSRRLIAANNPKLYGLADLRGVVGVFGEGDIGRNVGFLSLNSGRGLDGSSLLFDEGGFMNSRFELDLKKTFLFEIELPMCTELPALFNIDGNRIITVWEGRSSFVESWNLPNGDFGDQALQEFKDVRDCHFMFQLAFVRTARAPPRNYTYANAMSEEARIEEITDENDLCDNALVLVDIRRDIFDCQLPLMSNITFLFQNTEIQLHSFGFSQSQAVFNCDSSDMLQLVDYSESSENHLDFLTSGTYSGCPEVEEINENENENEHTLDNVYNDVPTPSPQKVREPLAELDISNFYDIEAYKQKKSAKRELFSEVIDDDYSSDKDSLKNLNKFNKRMKKKLRKVSFRDDDDDDAMDDNSYFTLIPPKIIENEPSELNGACTPCKPLKSILKRVSRYDRLDNIPTTPIYLDGPSTSAEAAAAANGSYIPSPDTPKKTVRFNEVVQLQLFRSGLSILSQRQRNMIRRTRKLRVCERRPLDCLPSSSRARGNNKSRNSQKRRNKRLGKAKKYEQNDGNGDSNCHQHF